MLIQKELKKIMLSAVYLLYVAVTVLDLYSQDVLSFSGDRITEPQPDGYYGTKNEEIPEIIMPAALQELYGEFAENDYRTYPIGFIKHVRLNEEEQGRIAEILAEITGTNISYTEFKTLMQEADDILGGGSGYAAESLIGYGNVPITYEKPLVAKRGIFKA